MAFGIDDVFTAVAILSTIKKMVGGEEEPEQQLGIPPASGAGGFGVPQIDLSELGQQPQQAPDYSGGGSTFGQAMGAFQPMRLSDVLRPQISLGEGQFSLGKQKRRF